MAGERSGGCRFGRVARVMLSVGAAAGMALALGCGGRVELHPALRVEGEDLERAVRRGQSLIELGADPNEAYTCRMVDVNTRTSAYVILRSAAVCWPSDEVAFQVAQQGDSSEAAVGRAANRAVRSVEQELKFVAVVQMPKEKDPASVEFLLRTNAGAEYPPLEVEAPVFLEDARSYYDASAPPSGMYQFVVRFPVRGGPGIPPIGPNVSTLDLVLRDEGLEATVEFPMPRVARRR